VQLVGALRYKPEDREVIRIFRLLNASGRTMVLGSTQPRSKNGYMGYFLRVKAAGAYD
jgi:hypothetical protein